MLGSLVRSQSVEPRVKDIMKSILAILALAVSSVTYAATDKPPAKPEGTVKAAETPKPVGTSGASTPASKDAAKPDRKPALAPKQDGLK